MHIHLSKIVTAMSRFTASGLDKKEQYSCYVLEQTPKSGDIFFIQFMLLEPGRVAQSVGHPTHKSGVLGSIPGLATYFRFSFRFFKKGSCQLLAKVCARSTGYRKSVVRLTDRPDMTLDVYRGRKTTNQQHVVGCNNIECNFASQHNCDVVNYVNYVNFYVDFVASN